PKALISTSSSSPDSIVIIGSGPKRNRSSNSYDECPPQLFSAYRYRPDVLFYDMLVFMIICMHIVKRRHGCFEGRTRSPHGQEGWGIPAARTGSGSYPSGISPPGERPRASAASGKRALCGRW